jgi:hypothetical protein
MRNSPLLFFTAVLLPIIASAASPEPRAGDLTARMERAAELLANRADADSQAAAALLNSLTRREQSLRQVMQATVMAPGRADLAWLHIRLCHADSTCDPAPLEIRLRNLDEKNGAGWLDALARAGTTGDEEAKSAALAAIGRSERVDTYWTTLIARLTRQVAGTGAASLFDAEGYVIGALAAISIPAYQSVSNACKGERLLRDDVMEVCRGVAKSFLNGDTGIAEMIGVAIAKRAWPENSPNWVAAARARRTWDYRAQAASSLDAWIEAHSSEHLALYERLHREQEVIKAMLIAVGRNPDPPPEDGQTAVRAP